MPSDAPNGNLKIMAIVKAAIACMLVATAMYCVIMQIETPSYFIELVLGVLGIYYGFSAYLYKQSSESKKTTDVGTLKALIEEEVARQLTLR
jgi:hypothetical protein